MWRFAICIFSLVIGLSGHQAAAQSCVAPANANALATEIAVGVNASRRDNGLGALSFNQRLGQAAMAHACDMVAHDFFDHQGSNGSQIQDRVQAAGYRSCIVAENLAWGYPQPAQIITGWMNSQGHRDNMLHPRVTEYGIGITQGAQGPYWVLVLGKPC